MNDRSLPVATHPQLAFTNRFVSILHHPQTCLETSRYAFSAAKPAPLSLSPTPVLGFSICMLVAILG